MIVVLQICFNVICQITFYSLVNVLQDGMIILNDWPSKKKNWGKSIFDKLNHTKKRLWLYTRV